MYFYVAIVLSDVEMYNVLNSTMKFWKSVTFSDLGQGSLICLLSTVLNGFSSATTGSVSVKLHMRPPDKAGVGVRTYVLVT